ncbi:MAG: DUF1016 N-terminal domain-containing protein [Leptospira sp.]|nr:DUF1016 N-terminal domain-containing protein [Leptospira sp.]
MTNSKRAYNSLLTQISQILVETRKDFKEGSNRFVLTSNWEIGRRITEIEQDGKTKANYGERIISRLSEDLNKRFGSGYSERQLFGMRKFFQDYKMNQIQFALSWSQYRALIAIKDRDARNSLELEAVKKAWTQRKLETVIRSRMRNNGQNPPSPPFKKGVEGDSNEMGLLERSKGMFYHYRIGSPKKLLKTGNSRRFVDLGFR